MHAHLLIWWICVIFANNNPQKLQLFPLDFWPFIAPNNILLKVLKKTSIYINVKIDHWFQPVYYHLFLSQHQSTAHKLASFHKLNGIQGKYHFITKLNEPVNF